MTTTKLYLIEGIPGSGKSTTASFVHNLLTEHHVDNQLFIEGNPYHPAEYESVSCLTDAEVATLLQKHADHRKLLEAYTFANDGFTFISYGKMRHERKDVPESLLHDLAQKDVYELPLETHCQVALAKWGEFVEKAKGESGTYVFECCFLQNPFSVMLAKHNADKERIFAHVRKIAELLAPLNPALIYFHSDDVQATLDPVIAERHPSWYEFITYYYTEQAYGKHHGVAGKAGVLHFLETRSQYERELLAHLQLPHTILLQNAGLDRERSLREIAQFVRDVQTNESKTIPYA